MTSEQVDSNAQKSRTVTGWKWLFLVLSIVSSTFLYALDNTILANIRPSIIQSFGHIEELPWISVAYALGEVAFNPLWGKLYGNFDNKILYCAAVAIFDAGTALCGASPNGRALIAGRVIAGIGGSGIYIGNLNIFSAMTLVNERAAYLSYVGAAWCLGTILGPIIGGALAISSATWRWSFYVNLGISAAMAPAYLWVLPMNPSKIQKREHGILKLDFLGAVLYTGAGVALVTAISFGGVLYQWGSARILASFVVSLILWILFGAQQKFCIFTDLENRLFPIGFLKDPEMCLLFVETAIGISCVVVPVYFLPLFYQFVRDADALAAGIHTLPFIFSAVVGCLLNGALFEKFTVYFLWFTVGGALATIGAGLMLTIKVDTSNAQIYGFSVLIGFGGGIFAQAGYAVGHARQPTKRHSQVTAFLSCAQMAGVALSLGIGTSVFANQATGQIAGIFPQLSRSAIQEAVAGADSALFSTLGLPDRIRVFGAITKAIRDVFIMVSCSSVLAVILSIFMKHERLFTIPKPTSDDEKSEI